MSPVYWSIGRVSPETRRALRTTIALAALAALLAPQRGTAQSSTRVGSSEESAHELHFRLSFADVSIAEGDEGSRALQFTVQLSEVSAETVWVDVSTADSTATLADLDYEPLALRLAFAPGSVAESLAVQVNGDKQLEPDEFLTLALTNPTGATLVDSVAVGTLRNDDFPELSIEDATVQEGDEGTRPMWFRLQLSEAAPWDVHVNVATSDSTATVAGGDYAPLALPFTLAAGTVLDSVAVNVNGDASVEALEYLKLRLSDLSGAVFADSEAVGHIQNDDLPTISVADTSQDEGFSGVHSMHFRVRLTPAMSTPVSFRYQTLDGTASIADRDYKAVERDTMFLPGEDLLLLPVPVIGDSLLEANERFTLKLSEIQGAKPDAFQAIGTVRNDERTSFLRHVPSVPMLAPGTFPPAWGDVDGDGLSDLLLYENTGAGFTEMPEVRSMLGNGNYHGSAWCDFDRDGDMDVVVMPYDETSSNFNFTHLLENTSEGLQEVAPERGMDIEGHGETPSWGDFNADGWPDLFLPFYSHVAPFQSYFYVNLGNGQFLERADSAGVSLPAIPPGLRVEGVAVADWNGDGTLDLYAASHFFLNDGDAHFTNVRAQVGLPVVFDEGCQFVDFDDDGDLDLYMRTASGPTLFRNDEGTFQNATSMLGIGTLGWEFGDRWADFDADGDLDLLFFPPGAIGRLLLSQGDGTYVEDTSFVGTLTGSSLAAFADFDLDGDMDMAVGANGRQIAINKLERVPTASPTYLKVRLEDDDGRLVMHGSTVRLRSLDDPRHPIQTRIVDGGSGYLGQDEYTLTFGGVGSGRFDLEVSFPGKPGALRNVGPVQNSLLGGLRPGLTGPQLIVVRPSGQVTIEGVTAEADVDPVLGPALHRLSPAAPNPARRATQFALTVPAGEKYTLSIHDLSGRRVRALEQGSLGTGGSNATWDLRDDAGRDVPPGLYFARLQWAGARPVVQRVIVLR